MQSNESTPPVEDLDHFLTDLGGRRSRLLRLVATVGPAPDLAQEIEGLGEQLITAEEELRVQQAELVETQRQLDQLVAERVALEEFSTDAHVLTDDRGVTVRFNRQADELLRRPSGRMDRRPLTSWFATGDRLAVRTLITHLRAGQSQAEADVHLMPVGAGPVPVRLSAATDRDPQRARTLFRWRILPIGQTTAVPGSGAGGSLELVTRLTAFAEVLLKLDSEQLVLETLVDAVVAELPGVSGATVTAVIEGTKLAPQGSAFSASLNRSAAGARPATTQVGFGDRRGISGVLNLERLPGGDAGPGDVLVAQAFATQASIALRRLTGEEHWRRAVGSRQQIGEAVGVLVERHRLTPEAAFQRLKVASQNSNVRVRDLARLVVETGIDPDGAVRL